MSWFMIHDYKLHFNVLMHKMFMVQLNCDQKKSSILNIAGCAVAQALC